MTPISKLRKEADKLWQEKGKAMSKKCVVCKKPTQVCHHYFAKSVASSLRYDLENSVQLCNGCHFSHHNGNPEIHLKVEKIRGDGWLNGLRERRKKDIQITVGYFKKVIEELKQ